MHLVLYQHPFALRPEGRKDPEGVDEARPWRDIVPLPWPADMDELDPAKS